MRDSVDQGELWDRWADGFDVWHGDADPTAAARFLRALKGDGPYLELGVGTGRLALALAGAGAEVVGVDISPRMLEKLEEKRGDLPVTAVLGSMVDVEMDRRFAAVYCVYSSFLGVVTQREQARCFLTAARLLEPDGLFVLEIFHPTPALLEPSRQLILRHLDADKVMISATEVDLATQRISFQEITLSAPESELLPVEERFCWPSELDLMAELAGMFLVARHGDFAGAPFTADSPRCISIFGLRP